MKTIRKENLTRIGFVNKLIGYKGLLSCLIDVSKPEKILDADFLFVILEGLPVPFEVEEMEINNNEIRLKLSDVDTDTEAKKLLRAELYAENIKGKKSKAIMSWKDVKGYMAIDATTGELGIIEEVLEYPMQMIARCMVNQKEALFPLNDDLVTDIDRENKKLFLNLPEGLLDVYL